jgi:hypothetical protein
VTTVAGLLALEVEEAVKEVAEDEPEEETNVSADMTILPCTDNPAENFYGADTQGCDEVVRRKIGTGKRMLSLLRVTIKGWFVIDRMTHGCNRKGRTKLGKEAAWMRT